jgi:hypothetical protein
MTRWWDLPPERALWSAERLNIQANVLALHAALGLDSAVDYDTGVIVSEAEAITCDMKRRRDLRRVAVSENA